MSTVIEDLEKRALKQRPRFAAGDRVRVHFQVVEGNRRRTQVFEGIVIKRQGSGAREKVGRSARVAERRWGIEEEMVVAAEEAEAVDAEGVAVTEAEPEVVEPAEEESAEEEQSAEGEQQDAAGGETAEAESEPEQKQKADTSPDGEED